MTPPDEPETPALLERARTTPHTRSAIGELSGSIDPTHALAALDRARRDLDEHAVTTLLLALAAAGQLPAAAAFVPALELIADLDQFVGMLMMSPDDPSGPLLDLIEGGTLSDQRECVAAFVLAELHRRNRSDQPADPRLHKLLRSKIRRAREPSERAILALSVARLADPDLTDFAEEFGKPHVSPVLERRLVQKLHGDWHELVPEREPPRVQVGTARREEPKVQRNDPCPCGSGRKYKKCCFTKGATRDAEVVVQPPAARDYASMRPAEIARLDPAGLDHEGLVECFRVARNYRQWELAERFLDSLDEHLENPQLADDFRHELCMAASAVGAKDVVERTVARAHDPDRLTEQLGLEIELLRPDAVSTAKLETKADAGLRGDAHALCELAFSLLDHSPALGILVARGALDPERSLDSWTLVQEIERARDRLLLPPGDPAARTYHRMSADHADAAARRAEGTVIDEMARSLEANRKALESTQREAVALQRRIDAATSRISELEAKDSERSAAPTPATEPAPDTTMRNELVRLRGRVTELKGLVNENRDRRKALERQLEEHSQPRRDQSVPDERGGATDRPDEDGVELVDEELAPRSVCVPIFAGAAGEALRRLDRPDAARIVRAIGLVAAADPAAWREVKALRASPGNLRLRVGNYRVLFREDPELQEMHVGQIVVRGELEAAVRRLG